MHARENRVLQVLLMFRGQCPIENIASWEASDATKHFLEEVAFLQTLAFRDALGEYFTIRMAKSVYTLLCKGPLDVVLADFKKLDISMLHAIGEPDAVETLNGVLSECSKRTVEVLGPLRFYLDFVARDGDITAMGHLHQVFQFATRVTISDHPDAERNAFIKYQMSIYNILAHDDVLATEGMQDWCKEIFRGYENPFGCFSPHHSAGAVAEKGINPHNGRYRDVYPEERWAMTNGPITQFCLSQAGIQSYPAPYHKMVRRHTKLLFVPKGVDTRRIVEPEPVQLLFNQHGLAQSLNTVLQRKLMRHYCQRDSSVNTRMARDASITRLYDTLDLSSASDSVRWSLVKSLFCRLPKWERLLRLLRSTISKWPDGRFHPKVMYGSMGNPLTFPLEVLVFCALIEEAGRRCGKHGFNYWVYGDDLIVPHWLTETLIEVLTEFGFVVNVDKSYIGDCPFRESCGGDFLDGVDVTPTRISRSWTGSYVRKGKHMQPKQVISLVDMANRASSRLPLVRWYCIHTLQKNNQPIVFSSDRTGSCVCWSARPSNLHLRSVPSDGEGLQYRKVKCAVPYVKQRKLPQHEWVDAVRYWHWLQIHSTDSKRSPLMETLEIAMRTGTPQPLPGLVTLEDGKIGFDEKDLIPKLARKGEIGMRYSFVPDIYT
jgi:hypothetical protein